MNSSNYVLLGLLAMALPATPLSAVDTGVPPAILSIRPAGPSGAGIVAPLGLRQVYESGDTVGVTATPAAGYEFSGWTCSGNGSVADPAAPATTVTLIGNVELTAWFRVATPTDAIQVRTAAEPALGGTVAPSDPITVTAGTLIPVSATANSGFQFLHWTVAGSVELTDLYAASATAAITGPAAITAVFAADAELARLTISATPGGVVRHSGSVPVPTGGVRPISALPREGFSFQEWQASGAVSVAQRFSADTVATVGGDSSVTAVFIANSATFSHKGRKVKIARKSSGGLPDAVPADSLRLAQMPLDLHPDEFNPNTDEIVISIDGIEFVVNNANGIFKRLPIGYSHTVFDTVTKSKRKLVLNFTTSTWSFQANKVDLSGIDNRDGIFIAMHVAGRTFGEKYDMTESLDWRFDPTRHSATALPVAGATMPDTRFASISGKSGNRKPGSAVSKLSSFPLTLPAGRTFNPAAETVTLRLDRQHLVIPPGSFSETRPGVFLFLDPLRGIKIMLDQNNRTCALEHRGFSDWGTLTPDDGLNVTLSIGNAQSCVMLSTSFTQTLTYDYKKFYWGKR